jgi:hypothetical protein
MFEDFKASSHEWPLPRDQQPAGPDAGRTRPGIQERRGAERTRCFLPAQIVFNDGASRIECMIKNVSARGALVVTTGSTPVPLEFDLFIPRRNETKRAVVRWSNQASYGVVFESRRQSFDAEEPHGLALRVKRLEAELASLRNRVRALEKDSA